MQAAQPLFGIIPTGLPALTTPTESESATSVLYTIPPTKPFRHLAVFLLPGVTLPAATAAAIYLVTAPAPGATWPTTTFLGGVGEGKESAIFRLPDAATAAANVVIGISIEDGPSVAARIGELAAARGGGGGSSTALVGPVGGGSQNPQGQQPSTLVLAQRIIKNAFNFLASFSGQAGAVEVVPLRAFEEWWRKFESRVRTDPGFLERDDV